MLTTSEGSPRAALLQQAVSKGQMAAHMSPLSFVRPPMHGGPVNGVMTTAPPQLRGAQNNNQQAQLLALVMKMMAAQRGNK